MSRDDPAERLISLVQRVPLLAIDEQAAQQQGDEQQLAYARAVRTWRAEAAALIAQVRQSSTARLRPAWPASPCSASPTIQRQANP